MKLACPIISAGVVAKIKNPQTGKVTSSILLTLTGGKILSITNMHVLGLRLKTMRFNSIKVISINE